VLISSPALAQQSSNSISLDAGDQKLAAWKLGDVTAFNSVHAAVTVNRIDPAGGPLTPGFKMNLQNADGSEQATIYIGENPNGRHMEVLVQHFKDLDQQTSDGGSFVTAMDLDMGKTFDLSLDWSDGKQLVAKINGGEAVSTPIGSPPKSIELDVTGGAIDLKPIELEQK
jgi:hypothetical protein